jgi:hypothetical protein
MRILLYNPDNGVTRNFMPHLWMFLLQALTPPEHEVILIDGNAQAMNEQELVQFVRDENIGLVGIGAMTRMVARAYKVADALREADRSQIQAEISRFQTEVERAEMCLARQLPPAPPAPADEQPF